MNNLFAFLLRLHSCETDTLRAADGVPKYPCRDDLSEFGHKGVHIAFLVVVGQVCYIQIRWVLFLLLHTQKKQLGRKQSDQKEFECWGQILLTRRCKCVWNMPHNISEITEVTCFFFFHPYKEWGLQNSSYLLFCNECKKLQWTQWQDILLVLKRQFPVSYLQTNKKFKKILHNWPCWLKN